MTITREQVADLQPGDVVEVTNGRWPQGTVVRGPVRIHGDTLQVGDEILRHWDGRQPFDSDKSLTVVSRVPRPLYVNHPRTEPVPGDVVRNADDGDASITWTWAFDVVGEHSWRKTVNTTWRRRNQLPDRLRLLVDGETGQVVQ